MDEVGFILFLFYGALFGARHALEPDHLAAVSTMAAHGRSVREILKVAGAWGAGHASLVAALGAALILLPWELPTFLANRAESLVGLLMVGMGLYVLWSIRRSDVHLHRHEHGASQQHVHFHSHSHPQGVSHGHPTGPHWLRNPRTAYLVGSVHGLAGSGAATALAVAAAPSALSAVAYLALFGLGSIAGMLVAAAVALWPIVRFSSASNAARRFIQGAAGSASVAIGGMLIWQSFA